MGGGGAIAIAETAHSQAPSQTCELRGPTLHRAYSYSCSRHPVIPPDPPALRAPACAKPVPGAGQE
eukprot:8418608-Pyramimonas_sp.AAC.1